MTRRIVASWLITLLAATLVAVAGVISWSRRSITVRAPSMAPGTAKVYITVGGWSSSPYRFSSEAATIVRGRTFSTPSQYGNVIGADNGRLRSHLLQPQDAIRGLHV